MIVPAKIAISRLENLLPTSKPKGVGFEYHEPDTPDTAPGLQLRSRAGVANDIDDQTSRLPSRQFATPSARIYEAEQRTSRTAITSISSANDGDHENGLEHHVRSVPTKSERSVLQSPTGQV
jgi:hypothetical protein